MRTRLEASLVADGTSALARVLPRARLVELDHVDLAVPPARAWELVRHGDLARSPIARGLFALRTLPERLRGHATARDAPGLRVDALCSSHEQPGFQILVDEPPREVVVGAIGKVWKLDIPFVHVDGADAFAGFDEPGFVKVAWALRVRPRGDADARVEIEVRVHATDEASWRRFRRYFRLIGPASRWMRRTALAALAHDLGVPEAAEPHRPLPGDELLVAAEQLTHGITIAAPPARIWPWLVQMGGRRAGFYSIDRFDNGGRPSARELRPELQDVHVGDVLPATPTGDDGFEILELEPGRALVLGGLWDALRARQLRFDEPRPTHFWQVTWAFVLEPLDAGTTRLHVRARAAFSPDRRAHVTWIRPVHALMETVQLRRLAARAEGRVRDDWRDVVAGIGEAARSLLARGRRDHEARIP